MNLGQSLINIIGAIARKLRPPRPSYSRWCIDHNCDHAHCPNECEHPQPFVVSGGMLLCGRCFFKDSERVEMIACTPETCPE